jgi:hypothetical protein
MESIRFKVTETEEDIGRRALATPSPVPQVVASKASADVLGERQRQIDVENWAPEHDDQYHQNELVRAALCYLLGNPSSWPWEYRWWKPADRRRNLVKAVALIIAEIERLDRAALLFPKEGAE